MMMRSFVAELKANLMVRYIRARYWHWWIEHKSKKIDDYTCICNSYEEKLGRKIHLAPPVCFYEKLNWLKLFYRDPLIGRCSDKEYLRGFLIEKGFGNLAVNQIKVFDSVDEIDWRRLPEKFALKVTPGSGWNLICKDKAKVDWRSWRRLFGIWTRMNPYWFGREWNYSGLEPRIILEEYMEDDSGELRDYKVFCLNGHASFMLVNANRLTDLRRNYYDCDGNILDMGDSICPRQMDERLRVDCREIFRIADELSKPFPFVRIDFYEVNHRLHIGEFTFFDEGGFDWFHPDEWNRIWGDRLKLPEPNHNLELYRRINGM